jgi:hypothetical protein
MSEERELSLRGIAVGVGIILAGIGVSLGAAALLVEPVPAVDGKGMALQTDPAADYAAYAREKAERLGSRGPLEGDPGHVHIPIEQAMQMLASGARR